MISRGTTHLNRYNPFLWGVTGYGSGIKATPPVSTDPSLTVWYDAINSSYNPSAPTDGTYITAWGDKSAAAHDANTTGNNVNKPRYQTNIQNGKPNVYFDGANDEFTINPFTNMQGLSGYTYFLVGKANVTTAQTISVMKANSGGDIRELYLTIDSGGKWAVGAGTGLATSKTADTNYHIHTIIFEGGLTGNARLRHRIDGVEQTLTFTNTPNATASATTTYMYIGQNTGGTGDFNGYLGELVIYTTKLPEADIISTEQYFKNQWAVV